MTMFTAQKNAKTRVRRGALVAARSGSSARRPSGCAERARMPGRAQHQEEPMTETLRWSAAAAAADAAAADAA